MTSSISSFLLRDTILKRQGRTARARRVPELTRSSSTNNQPLNIILEEDESRLSSRSPSPVSSTSSSGSRSPGIKAKRRHANISDIRIARDAAFLADDLSPIHNTLFTPRPAPSPPTKPSNYEQSPDPFRLTFTDVSFKFPHPPVPLSGRVSSPTHSISSLSSSPCSQNGGMPLTPFTSDDESPDFLNPRCVPIRPLVITKHNPRPSSPHDLSISPSLLHPFNDSSKQVSGENARLSPYAASFLDDSSDDSDDSDAESDSEWYTRQFSKILTLHSPIPPSFPLQNPSRPESISIPADVIDLPSLRTVSKTLPPTPFLTYRDSLESFTGPPCPSKRTSKIPKYPPPPVPPIPVHLRPDSMSNFTSCSKTLPTAVRRPPPRSSIPADCDFELDVADDASSEFSFSMYDIDLIERDGDTVQSPDSAYSQPSLDDDNEEVLSAQDITFDLDYSTMMLPLSLPASPFDLEADFAVSLQRLRTEDTVVEQPSAAFVEPKSEALEQIPQVQLEELLVDDKFSPVSSAFSFSPAPSIQYPSPIPSPASPQHKVYNDEKVLKSKWSTSTLGSVREEHERRGTSSKLRLYFGGGQSPVKSKRTSSSAAKKVSPTPTLSPFGGMISPKKASRGRTSSSSSSASPPAVSPSRSGQHARGHSRGHSDVMVIGYGGSAVGVRRRGSLATVSDAGSVESASSTSSSGLRRKPIPIEMFLRSDLPVFLKSAA